MKTKLLTIFITSLFFLYILVSINYANATGMDFYMDDGFHGYGSSSGGYGILLLVIFAIIIAAFFYLNDFINKHGIKKILKTSIEIAGAFFLYIFIITFFFLWISGAFEGGIKWW